MKLGRALRALALLVSGLSSNVAFANPNLQLNPFGILESGSSSFSGGSITNPATLADGSAGTPSLSFTSDLDTGLYWIGANNFGFSAGGTLRMDLSSSALTLTVPARLGDGAVGAPAFSFSGDTDTGLYRIGANNLGLATNGVLAMDWSATNVTSALPILIASGSVSAPGLALSADADGTGTGFYRFAANSLSLAVNGVRAMGFGQGSLNLLTSGGSSTALTTPSAGLIYVDNGGTVPGMFAAARSTTLQTSTYTPTLGTTGCNHTIYDLTDNAVITLPAVSTSNRGCEIRIVNTAAAGAALLTITPNASDGIYGIIINSIANVPSSFNASGADAASLLNTKATHVYGDYVTLESDGVNGWLIIGGKGVWTN